MSRSNSKNLHEPLLCKLKQQNDNSTFLMLRRLDVGSSLVGTNMSRG